MRIFFTGVSGLLGINFALAAAPSHEVLGTYNKQMIETDLFQCIPVDLFSEPDLDALIQKWQPDWIVHSAALTDVNLCEKDPALADRINVQLSKRLAKIAQQNQARFLYISTDSVFDGTQENYTETDQTAPINVYGKTKLQGEQAVLSACDKALIARVNFYGWSLSGMRSLAEWVVTSLRAGKPIQGYTDVCFSPLLANSLAKILMQMMQLDLSGIYHVTGNDPITKYDFAVALAQEFDFDLRQITPSRIQDAKEQAVRPLSLKMNNMKLRRAIADAVPALSDDIKLFHQLELNGYTQAMRAMLRRRA